MSGRKRLPIKNKKSIWNELLLMYGEKCVYCHSQIATQIDHVIPYSCLPCHDLINLRPSCIKCNLIASDKVFDDFEAKYKYIRSKYKTRDILRCCVCTIPFYSALHSNQFYCPLCYEREYQTGKPLKADWFNWLDTLVTAGMFPLAYQELSDSIFVDGVKLTLKVKTATVNNRILELMSEAYERRRNE